MITNNKGSPVPPLRDYQQEALARMQHYEGRAALLVLATGLGKTRIFTEFLRWEVNENDHHCLILSHREELVHQPLTYLQDLTCGVELADKRANHEPIISASVQSLVSRLDKYNPREIDTIIVDAAYYNRKYERIGTLFQDRYKSQPVTTVGYFLRVLRYIHNNPVAAGITDTMADYPWSSYRDYFATRSTCICKVHTEYAMQIKTHDELLQWHTKTEINTRGILDVDNSKSKVSDAEINHIITILTGMPAAQLQRLPEEKQAQVFQRLIDEESIGFSQLARLTGIEKGRIKRLIL